MEGAAPWDDVSPQKPARSITRVDPRWSHAADPLRDSLAEEFLDPLDVNFEACHQPARDGEVRLGFHQFASQQFEREFELGICHVSTVPPAAGRVYARFGCDGRCPTSFCHTAYIEPMCTW